MRPIPATKHRNGYMGTRHFEFWRSGLELYWLQKHVLGLHGVDVTSPPPHLAPFRVLDFGGSTGRLSRHWALYEKHIEVITTDTNINAVGYVCKSGLGSALHNDFVPSLEIASGSISFFVALSVWTHMTPVMALTWLKEVKRVLRPGGYAWITIMGDHTWRRIHFNKEKDLLYQHIIGGKEKLVPDHGEPKNFTLADLNKYPNMPSTYPVFVSDWRWPYRAGIQGETMVNAFCSYEFVNKYMSEIMEVVAIYPQNSLVPPEEWGCVTPQCNPTRTIGQDVVLFRKRK